MKVAPASLAAATNDSIHGIASSTNGVRKEDLVDAFEGSADRGRVREVEGHDLGPRVREVLGLGRVAHAGPHRSAGRGDRRRHLPPNRSRSSCDECLAHGECLSGPWYAPGDRLCQVHSWHAIDAHCASFHRRPEPAAAAACGAGNAIGQGRRGACQPQPVGREPRPGSAARGAGRPAARARGAVDAAHRARGAAAASGASGGRRARGRAAVRGRRPGQAATQLHAGHHRLRRADRRRSARPPPGSHRAPPSISTACASTTPSTSAAIAATSRWALCTATSPTTSCARPCSTRRSCA